MRLFTIGAGAAAIVALLCVAIAPGFGADYLIIKRKDGTTQKVPLQFDPEDIESFDVESKPGEALPPPQEPAGQPKVFREQPQEPSREGMPMEVTPPGQPPTTGAVPGKTIAAPQNQLVVNVYRLPEKVKSIPDYSAFSPQSFMTAGMIRLGSSEGPSEPMGLPKEADGLGLRIMGTFEVRGEGIFQWRVRSKDGARLHIDDKTLIENDGIHAPASKTGYVHLAEGLHTLILDAFNSEGEPVLELFVTPPFGNEQIFTTTTPLRGWEEPEKPYDVLWAQVYFVPKGKYPKGPDLSKLSPIGRLIASELDTSGDGGFPGLPGREDYIGMRYEGYFTVKGSGLFAFRLEADDYGKLTIGDHKICEVTDGAKKHPEGDIGWAYLQDGSYPINVEYFHSEGPHKLALMITEPKGEEKVFSPSETPVGYSSDEALIPGFVYFLKPRARKLPNFNKLTPVGMMFTNAIDFPPDRGTNGFEGVPLRDTWLGLRFFVKFSLSEEEEGVYRFRLRADDGAKLIIGKKLVVDADGYRGMREGTGTITLKKGSHEMFVDYYQAKGASALQLWITAPDGEEKLFAFQ
jgi:hypothetical protein